MKLNFYLGFNNYYNRKVIVYNSIQDYQDYLLLSIDNVNFKPSDGINTEHVVNTTQKVDYQMFNIESIPDYAIVTDDYGMIISRWFVTQWTSLIYKNQYKATLRRDLIADNYDTVIDTPCFIEKATITNTNDIALFNNENMGFNQIKTSETPLKDTSKISWIVGYIPNNSTFQNTIIRKVNGYYYKLDLDSDDLNNIPSLPYKMFCIPYADITCYRHISDVLPDQVIQCNKDVSLSIATGIASTIGSGNIYDLQLLPYCPLRTSDGTNMFVPDATGETIGQYNITNITPIGQGTNFYYIYETNENGSTLGDFAGVLFWCDTNKFTFDIPYTIDFPTKAEDIKVNNECDMYRLCSPNFNGMFEFNPVKNGGVTKFNVDCMYQPFNPYIHINPDFNLLYGSDFDDCRGLICQGDFSLPQETSAWANFVQNNKNYQNSFDRQIQNMEFNNKYQMASQITGAITGALGTGATGFMLGGPMGAGIMGGLSVAGGIADTIMLADKQKETLDYTKDQFDFNMQNIKAIPNSISKTNPITNNNKIFPILEKYTCTDIEKQALKDKLKYNGMTIGRIGKISDFLTDDYTYIKGKVIMLDNIEEDYHSVLEIAQEIDKGIRIKNKESE